MGIKKRAKVSAQFSMSSLTDIIFLLLIFFMLTSSLVAPNALNLKLPGSSTARASTNTRYDEVRITTGGNFFLNGRRIDLATLEQELARRAGPRRQDFSFLIAPATGTPVEHVVAIMDIALRLQINGVLAADK